MKTLIQTYIHGGERGIFDLVLKPPMNGGCRQDDNNAGMLPKMNLEARLA